MALTTKEGISVLMSVYKNDSPEYLTTAINSILAQTLPPDEIVIVVDGPVSEALMLTLNDLSKANDIIRLEILPENVGLGLALQHGTNYCQYTYIARMDSDDIALPDRLKKQMEYMTAHPECDVVGTFGQEFIETPDQLAGYKTVPTEHDEIVKFLRTRCPFCHMSVLMKRETLLAAGGYQDWYYAEDWYSWVRLYLHGANFHNLNESLMLIRINAQTFARRGGLKYYRSIKGILKFIYKHHLLSFWAYQKAKFIRFMGHVIVPRTWRYRIYRRFLRKNNINS